MIDEKRIMEIKVHFEAAEVMLALMDIERMNMPEYQALLQVTMDGNWLIAEVERLQSEVAGAIREREAAVAGITRSCMTCINPDPQRCGMDAYYNQFNKNCERWQWRGMEETHGP